jgi:preprotein translocase subunit YajC
MKWDVFISYASEDKREVAQPIAEKLIHLGFRVWYDDRILELGDGLRRKIDEGLANSRYGVVILSPSFFNKNWPQKELDGLVARETLETKVILPILHNMKHEELVKYSPTLANRVYISTNSGIDEIVKKIEEIISSIEIKLFIDKTTFMTIEKESILKIIEEYLSLRNRISHLKVSIDRSLIMKNLYPRLNEYKGTRMSHKSPEEDYKDVIHRSDNIFNNMEFLINLYILTYSSIVNDRQILVEPIQKFCKLCLFNIYKYSARLLPLGNIENWFLQEFKVIYELLCKWSETQRNSYDADLFMKAYLMEIDSDVSNLDLVGNKNIECVTRLCIPDSIIQKDTEELLAQVAYVSPDSEIILLDWINWFLPQILYYHAISSADCNVVLKNIKEKIGLLKSDYYRMGYH